MKKLVVLSVLCAAILVIQGCSQPKAGPKTINGSSSSQNSASTQNSSSASSAVPFIQYIPVYTQGTEPVKAAPGTVTVMDDASKKEVSDYWQKLYGADTGAYNVQFYYPMSADKQAARQAMLEKYGISFYLYSLKKNNTAVQWESAYGLIQYFGTPQADTAIPPLSELKQGNSSAAVKAAAGFTLDILGKQFKSEHISSSADGGLIAFSDCFESTLGGSGRLWIIKGDKLYLDTFATNNYSCSINTVAVSPDGVHIAINFLGRKSSWCYVISPEKTDDKPGDLIDALNAPLKSNGWSLYHEPGHGVYYSTINKISWKDNDKLDLDMTMSLDDGAGNVGQEVLTGNVLYNTAKSSFDISGLTKGSLPLPSGVTKVN